MSERIRTNARAMNKHLHPSNTSHTDRFRSLDRALAAKYVQLVMAHRRRIAAAQSHGGELMRPRCVRSFLSPFFSDFPGSVEICDQPQSSFITATFEVPGLKKEEIGVHLTNDGRLTISGYRRAPPLLANTDRTFIVYPVKEIKYGRFERTINVPAGLEVKDINACLADGMLCVSWPRFVSPPTLPQGPTQVIGMA
jgi:HSP20 family protein